MSPKKQPEQPVVEQSVTELPVTEQPVTEQMRAYGAKLLSTVVVQGQPTPMALCPTCGQSWPANQAPWTQQKLHCPKHDRVRNVGTTCEFCDEEERRAKVDSGGDNSVVAPDTQGSTTGDSTGV